MKKSILHTVGRKFLSNKNEGEFTEMVNNVIIFERQIIISLLIALGIIMISIYLLLQKKNQPVRDDPRTNRFSLPITGAIQKNFIWTCNQCQTNNSTKPNESAYCSSCGHNYKRISQPELDQKELKKFSGIE